MGIFWNHLFCPSGDMICPEYIFNTDKQIGLQLIMKLCTCYCYMIEFKELMDIFFYFEGARMPVLSLSRVYILKTNEQI